MENNSSTLSLLLSSLGWILLVIMTAVFFFFGQNYYYQRGVEDGRAIQLQEDIAKVDEQLGGGFLNGPQVQVTGVIQSIEGNRVMVEAVSQSPNPLGSTDFVADKTIIIGTDTQIVRQIPKDPDVYEQEIEQARLNSAEGEVITVQPFTEQIVTADQLIVGATIVIQGGEQEDLAPLQEVNSTLIYMIDDELIQ